MSCVRKQMGPSSAIFGFVHHWKEQVLRSDWVYWQFTFSESPYFLLELRKKTGKKNEYGPCHYMGQGRQSVNYPGEIRVPTLKQGLGTTYLNGISVDISFSSLFSLVLLLLTVAPIVQGWRMPHHSEIFSGLFSGCTRTWLKIWAYFLLWKTVSGILPYICHASETSKQSFSYKSMK